MISFTRLVHKRAQIPVLLAVERVMVEFPERIGLTEPRSVLGSSSLHLFLYLLMGSLLVQYSSSCE